MAAEVSYNNAWYTFGGGLSKKQITSKSYTPFGEQIGEATSGFGYNGEYYNAASGMIYLRARFYAPEMNRFSQKDILRGSILQPVSLNRYLYVQNDPVNFVDPSGMRQVAGMYGDGTGRTSTTRSSSRTSYTPPSYPAPSGPARSTASSVNPYNTVRASSQAISDARRAADIANSQAPGSPAAYRATQAYYETQRLAAQAMASHNTQAGIKAVQTSQASVNYVNSSLGNVYSYYNSSYDTGKVPSADAPRIKDVDPASEYYCEKGLFQTDAKSVFILYTNTPLNESNFTVQAKFMKQQLEEKGIKVYMGGANDNKSFVEKWNNIPQDIDEVYVISHSNGNALITVSPSRIPERSSQGISIDGVSFATHEESLPMLSTSLKDKDFQRIVLYCCNGGNLDMANSKTGNIAMQFTAYANEVIAYDGSIAFGPGGNFLPWYFDNYEPRNSNDQESLDKIAEFIEARDQATIERRDENEGWVVFTNSGEIIPIGQMESASEVLARLKQQKAD